MVKKVCNSRKAFTLVELLAIIIILSVIAMITTPVVIDVINDFEEKAFIRDCEAIENGAKLYVTNKLEGLVEDNTMIPISDLTGYISQTGIPGEYVLVSVSGDDISYYYSGRDKNPYQDTTSLKELIEGQLDQISMNVKVNGEIVNKVRGAQANKETLMKNHVWFSGQLWQVVETNDNKGTIKLVTANSLTSISYGNTNEWLKSWVRKWLYNELYESIDRKDLVKDTTFCMDEIDIAPSSLYYTKMDTCTNLITEKVGLLTYEDYIYAKNGNTIQNGGSFLSQSEAMWMMTSPSDSYRQWKTNYVTEEIIINTANPPSTNWDDLDFYGYAVRPVISISDEVLVQSGSGTKADPYILTSEIIPSVNSMLNNATVGEYVYLDESNNPYTYTLDKISKNVRFSTTKNKIRYRIVSINEDGSVKLQRAAVLTNLPNTISVYESSLVPFYSYWDCLAAKSPSNRCYNKNVFDIAGSEEFIVNQGESIGYFLNYATNSFYNWFSDKSKSMIELSTWNRYTAAKKDYSNLNDSTVTSYPNRTDDGDIQAYVGLPVWGGMFSGNDLGQTYWLMNRWVGSNGSVTDVTSGGMGNATGSNSVLAVRPVINLKRDVYITGGNGTMTDPYTLDISV